MGRRKQTGGQDDAKRTDVIRVDGDLAHMLGIIASIERRSVSDIASPILRATVLKLYRAAVEKAGKLGENV